MDLKPPGGEIALPAGPPTLRDRKLTILGAQLATLASGSVDLIGSGWFRLVHPYAPTYTQHRTTLSIAFSSRVGVYGNSSRDAHTEDSSYAVLYYASAVVPACRSAARLCLYLSHAQGCTTTPPYRVHKE